MKKILVFCSFVLLSFAGLNAQEVADDASVQGPDEQGVYDKPEKPAAFPGGLDAYVRFMTANMNYPEKARKKGVEGTVVLSFIVDKSGWIRDIKVLKSLSKECDKEAIRMVKAMPRWFAAEHNGEKVNCRFTCPITFRPN